LGGLAGSTVGGEPVNGGGLMGGGFGTGLGKLETHPRTRISFRFFHRGPNAIHFRGSFAPRKEGQVRGHQAGTSQVFFFFFPGGGGTSNFNKKRGASATKFRPMCGGGGRSGSGGGGGRPLGGEKVGQGFSWGRLLGFWSFPEGGGPPLAGEGIGAHGTRGGGDVKRGKNWGARFVGALGASRGSRGPRRGASGWGGRPPRDFREGGAGGGAREGQFRKFFPGGAREGVRWRGQGAGGNALWGGATGGLFPLF